MHNVTQPYQGPDDQRGHGQNQGKPYRYKEEVARRANHRGEDCDDGFDENLKCRGIAVLFEACRFDFLVVHPKSLKQFAEDFLQPP